MPRKHHLRGFKIAKKNRLAAHRRWVKPPPPPWKKARSAPAYKPLKFTISNNLPDCVKTFAIRLCAFDKMSPWFLIKSPWFLNMNVGSSAVNACILLRWWVSTEPVDGSENILWKYNTCTCRTHTLVCIGVTVVSQFLRLSISFHLTVPKIPI